MALALLRSRRPQLKPERMGMNAETADVDDASKSSIDPVCGMTVDPTRAAGSIVHGG